MRCPWRGWCGGRGKVGMAVLHLKGRSKPCHPIEFSAVTEVFCVFAVHCRSR